MNQQTREWLSLEMLLASEPDKVIPVHSISGSTRCYITQGNAGFTYDLIRRMSIANMGRMLPERKVDECSNIKCKERGVQAAHVSVTMKVHPDMPGSSVVGLAITCDNCNPTKPIDLGVKYSSLVLLHPYGVDSCSRRFTYFKPPVLLKKECIIKSCNKSVADSGLFCSVHKV